MLDVMILNAYHRGDWLIEQYKGTSYAVETLDVTEAIGTRFVEDLMGPFGCFLDTNNEKSKWYIERHLHDVQKQGWALWMERGTWETNGLFKELNESSPSQPLFESALKNLISTTDRPLQVLKSTPALGSAVRMPYCIFRNFQSSPEKRRTVKNADKLSVSSVASHKVIHWNEHTFEAQFVVSFLLPHELMARASLGFNQLLTTEPLRPRLCWQRSRWRIESSLAEETLPLQLAIIFREQDPWIEDNFIILKKTGEAQTWDIWFKSWYEVHKEKKYFSEVQKRIHKNLQQKIPGAVMTCTEAPWEAQDKAAVSLYPVYDYEEWSLHTKFFDKGIFYGAADKCEMWTPAHALEVQQRIFNQIDEELKGG